jgi:hypothetical protein
MHIKSANRINLPIVLQATGPIMKVSLKAASCRVNRFPKAGLGSYNFTQISSYSFWQLSGAC